MTGLQISSQRLSLNPNEDDRVLVGSFVLFNCTDGYINEDRNLNVICDINGQWTPFPQCIPTSTPQSSTMQDPMRCPVTSDTWKINNGYLADTRDLLAFSDKTATGRSSVCITLTLKVNCDFI